MTDNTGATVTTTTMAEPAKPRRKWLVPTLTGVLGFLVGLGAGGAGKNTNTTATPTPSTSTTTITQTVTASGSAAAPVTTTVTATVAAAAPPPSAGTTIEDGTWTVGSDVQPGTYRLKDTLPAGSTCFWGIYKSGTNKDSIVQNDIVTGGRPTVTLKAGQDFESTRCGTWVKQ